MRDAIEPGAPPPVGIGLWVGETLFAAGGLLEPLLELVLLELVDSLAGELLLRDAPPALPSRIESGGS